MSLIDRAKGHSIATRAKAMILHPRSEWEVIEGEPATVRQLFMSYVIYLAAIRGSVERRTPTASLCAGGC